MRKELYFLDDKLHSWIKKLWRYVNFNKCMKNAMRYLKKESLYYFLILWNEWNKCERFLTW